MYEASPRPFLTPAKLLAILFAVAILITLMALAYSSEKLKLDLQVQGTKFDILGMNLLMYADDYDDKLPPAMSTNQNLRRYCIPYAKAADFFDSRNPTGGQILGNGVLAGRKIDDITDPDITVMLYDSRPWPSGNAALCYEDGGVKMGVPFETMLRQLTVDPFAKPARGGKVTHW